jgi:DNA-binding cell septation regulator SpoVG
MKITVSQIELIEKQETLASFEVNFEDALTIKDILLLRGESGFFISVPSRDCIEFNEALIEHVKRSCVSLYERGKVRQCS